MSIVNVGGESRLKYWAKRFVGGLFFTFVLGVITNAVSLKTAAAKVGTAISVVWLKVSGYEVKAPNGDGLHIPHLPDMPGFGKLPGMQHPAGAPGEAIPNVITAKLDAEKAAALKEKNRLHLELLKKQEEHKAVKEKEERDKLLVRAKYAGLDVEDSWSNVTLKSEVEAKEKQVKAEQAERNNLQTRARAVGLAFVPTWDLPKLREEVALAEQARREEIAATAPNRMCGRCRTRVRIEPNRVAAKYCPKCRKSYPPRAWLPL